MLFPPKNAKKIGFPRKFFFPKPKKSHPAFPKKKVRKFRFRCRSFCWSLWEFRIDHCILRDGIDGIDPCVGWKLVRVKKGEMGSFGGNWISRWVDFHAFFWFTLTWGWWSNFTNIFSNGLVQPPTRYPPWNFFGKSSSCFFTIPKKECFQIFQPSCFMGWNHQL